ncbi:hypothetical protein G7K_4230-t1 [Saitoella complicata NRRL Y-17804]|uniref:Uncharacterized protein n=1 Tax=Saitoella complicata (strain BCRC 22490 / CBS 7301 / JCM 7358 / NBRC 10748 / NRRL Y-17804) TaxID=698492 RepID=A0A0E9NL05_SAICN|nr:hypothetical protein G7K_4230-t1 [Saitoella complicata NRRL Y-17804]
MSPLIRVRGRKQPGKKTLRTSGASNRYTSNRSFQDDPEFDVDDDGMMAMTMMMLTMMMKTMKTMSLFRLSGQKRDERKRHGMHMCVDSGN